MQEYSKFRVITAGFILMFIFVVAAMYTNTKDITAQKVRDAELSRRNSRSINTVNHEVNNNTSFQKKQPELKFDDNNSDTYNDENIERLTNRMDQLERAFRLLESEVNPNPQSPLNCQIRGILDNGDVVPLSAKDSLEEANMNNKEVVITCSVK